MSDELKIAIDASKIGAKKALEFFGKTMDYEVKDDKSILTIADLKTEERIKEYLTKKFPKIGFVGEERGGDLKGDF